MMPNLAARRRLGRWVAIAALGVGLLLLYAWLEARSLPVVRTAAIKMADWPKNVPPLRIVLMSDIHLGNETMDEGRLRRIVAIVNRQAPDLILIAGDFATGHEAGTAALVSSALTRALTGLKSRFGTVAVLGNHDLWTGPSDVIAALRRAGIVTLNNEAIVRGPVRIAGIGDAYTGNADIAGTLAKAAKLNGAQLVLTHSPDLADHLPPGQFPVFAGHTHCGQIVLPLIGPPHPVAKLKYNCGLIRENGRIIVVTAGLGTSGVPFRLGAPPDIWVVELGGVR
jgi:uncharacterized protein